MAKKRERVSLGVFVLVTLVLLIWPGGRPDDGGIRCRAKVLSADNGQVMQHGIIKTGFQKLVLRVESGSYAGEVVSAASNLMGKLELDAFYGEGDRILAVLTVGDGGKIVHVTPRDHYRLTGLWVMVSLFFGLLLITGGETGARALVSFVLTGVMIWKVLIPALLAGWNPLLVSFGVVMILNFSVIFLVGGLNRLGLTAFCGATLGILTTCLIALAAGKAIHLNGAVKPFSEALLYAGYADLSLSMIFIGGIFLASSGAVMDLAMDIAASMAEVARVDATLSPVALMGSGLRVGRSVLGTMTTTLLLAYSGGFTSLLMAMMAQNVPLSVMLNTPWVSSEIIHTLSGSIGLVTVAPFTAMCGAVIYKRDAAPACDAVARAA
ncbi:YibE/F family protein [Desulfoluna spongiiphila]|uniref:YibE/F family protein n=1 Tax=Desulfoluna spongiiphila TaxID=419481 RepID=UPI00125551DF|nr:YibE/F family protein [Desulfoluna spongiiphila]VVS92547.1 yibe/f-like [Desulfoluna spongiiphila]